MAAITLRVLDGADRGKVFEGLATPVSIGREEGNTIQLNDDRVSRFHLKIQSDHDDLVLTDLDSTNGCKVNNEEVKLRILRHGDLITIGRSTLIFGDRAQINQRLDRLGQTGQVNDAKIGSNSSVEKKVEAKEWHHDPDYQLALLEADPPSIPDRLSPGQAAQLSEMIEYLHMQMRRVVTDVEIPPRKQHVIIPYEKWQKLLDVQARLAEYLQKISNPE